MQHSYSFLEYFFRPTLDLNKILYVFGTIKAFLNHDEYFIYYLSILWEYHDNNTNTEKLETNWLKTIESKYLILIYFPQASRAECIKQLWAYLKKQNLQDPENKQYFTPDKKMAKVFGTEKIRGFGMAKYLSDHLTKIDE